MDSLKISRQRRTHHYLIVGTAALSILLTYLFMKNVSNRPNSIQMTWNGDLKVNQIHGQHQLKFIEENFQQPKIRIDKSFFAYLVSTYRNTKYANYELYKKFTVAHRNLKPLTKVMPLRKDMGPVYNDFDIQFPITTSPCVTNGGDKPSLFIAVTSDSAEIQKRDIVRRTWMQHLKISDVAHLFDVAGFRFFIGKSNSSYVQSLVQEESHNNGDIIQADIEDSYSNTTFKSISILKWVAQFCPSAHYVIKTNDDVYVNVRNLAATVQILHPTDLAIYGKLVNDGSIVDRAKRNYSIDDWPWSNFPPHIDGSFYVLSQSAVKPLLAAAQATPYFQLDDVFLSGLCNRKAGVSIRTSPRIAVRNYTANLSEDQCFARRNISWVTNDTSPQMFDFHRSVEQLYGKDGPINCDTTENSVTNGPSINRTVKSDQFFTNDLFPVALDIVYNLE